MKSKKLPMLDMNYIRQVDVYKFLRMLLEVYRKLEYSTPAHKVRDIIIDMIRSNKIKELYYSSKKGIFGNLLDFLIKYSIPIANSRLNLENLLIECTVPQGITLIIVDKGGRFLRKEYNFLEAILDDDRLILRDFKGKVKVYTISVGEKRIYEILFEKS